MKKYFLILIFGIILLHGCKMVEKKEIKKDNKKEFYQEDISDTTPTYQDQNDTPISFYKLKGNRLEKVESISGNYLSMDDVTLLQIYPSDEEYITLNDTFANSFYNTWQMLNKDNSLKIGFNLKIIINNAESITYNILGPNQTMNYWEYFMAYLYDDYANRGKSYYSHIESNDYTDASLFTAIKLQCGGLCQDISSPVSLTVFTYDTEDDLENNTYRGNSKYTIPICMHGDC